jgi:protein translocase SecG subunit
MKSKNLKLVFLLALILSIFTGCTNTKPISKESLNREINETTKILVTTQEVISKQKSQKNKAFNLTSSEKSDLKEQLKKLNESENKIKKVTTNAAAYPKDAYKYNQLVTEYINDIIQSKKSTDVKQSYHKAVEEAYNIQPKYNGKENKYLNVAIALDKAAGNKVGSEDTTITPTKKDKKTNPKKNKKYTKAEKDLGIEIQKAKPKKQNKAVNISWGWVILFTLISAFLITSVFLQPNKSNDSMSALTTSGGAELYNLPKPRGYQLFIRRTTELSIVLLILALIIFNHVGGS